VQEIVATEAGLVTTVITEEKVISEAGRSTTRLLLMKVDCVEEFELSEMYSLSTILPQETGKSVLKYTNYIFCDVPCFGSKLLSYLTSYVKMS